MNEKLTFQVITQVRDGPMALAALLWSSIWPDVIRNRPLVSFFLSTVWVPPIVYRFSVNQVTVNTLLQHPPPTMTLSEVHNDQIHLTWTSLGPVCANVWTGTAKLKAEMMCIEVYCRKVCCRHAPYMVVKKKKKSLNRPHEWRHLCGWTVGVRPVCNNQSSMFDLWWKSAKGIEMKHLQWRFGVCNTQQRLLLIVSWCATVCKSLHDCGPKARRSPEWNKLRLHAFVRGNVAGAHDGGKVFSSPQADLFLKGRPWIWASLVTQVSRLVDLRCVCTDCLSVASKYVQRSDLRLCEECREALVISRHSDNLNKYVELILWRLQ